MPYTIDDTFNGLVGQLCKELGINLKEYTPEGAILERLLKAQFERGRLFERNDLQYVLKRDHGVDLSEYAAIMERFR